MRRGEVWWHEPPDAKRRPALILSLDNTFLAEKAVLTGRITELSGARMSEVCQALDAATGCG